MSVCYKCGNEGHFSRECPNSGGGSSRFGGGGSSGGRSCYKCGQEGHFSRECSSRAYGYACYKCGQEGHISRNCPNQGAYGDNTGGDFGGNSCPNRGSENATVGVFDENGFNWLGDANTFSGGVSADGDTGDRSYLPQPRSCFNCNKEGHISRDCPNERKLICKECQQEGHMRRDCPKLPPLVCRKCNQAGHMARDCTERGGGQPRCFKCGETGHLSFFCKKDDPPHTQ